MRSTRQSNVIQMFQDELLLRSSRRRLTKVKREVSPDSSPSEIIPKRRQRVSYDEETSYPRSLNLKRSRGMTSDVEEPSEEFVEEESDQSPKLPSSTRTAQSKRSRRQISFQDFKSDSDEQDERTSMRPSRVSKRERNQRSEEQAAKFVRRSSRRQTHTDNEESQ